MKSIQGLVTYGWGMIPATARINSTEWATSLFPKDDSYLLPLKLSVRRLEGLNEGQTVTVRLSISLAPE